MVFRGQTFDGRRLIENVEFEVNKETGLIEYIEETKNSTLVLNGKEMSEIEESSTKLKEKERVVMGDMLERPSDLFDREREIWNHIALAVKDDNAQ